MKNSVIAVRAAEEVITGLKQDGRMAITRIPNGTNIFELRLQQGDSKRFRERLRSSGVVVAEAVNGRFLLSVNETWNRAAVSAILDAFRSAAS